MKHMDVVKKKGLRGAPGVPFTRLAAIAALVALAGGCAQAPQRNYVRGQSNVPSPLDDLGSGAGAPAPASAPAGVAASRAPDAPDALKALNAMQAYLRSLRSFEVRADTATDVVRKNGQNVSLVRQMVIKVKQPDRLRSEITGDGNVIGIVYDGHRVTVYNRKSADYAQQDAPPTLAALTSARLAHRPLDVPFTDLRYWGFGPRDALAPASARVIGVERIDSRECTHYAYRQPGVDWELWIERGREPLPCRSVVTVTGERSRPRHEATYRWRLNPAFPASTFVFHPAHGAQAVAMPSAPRSPFGEPD